VDIREAQGLAWEHKLAKGFNVTDVPLEFCPVNGERVYRYLPNGTLVKDDSADPSTGDPRL
jgi:hypothetical protein